MNRIQITKKLETLGYIEPITFHNGTHYNGIEMQRGWFVRDSGEWQHLGNTLEEVAQTLTDWENESS